MKTRFQLLFLTILIVLLFVPANSQTCSPVLRGRVTETVQGQGVFVLGDWAYLASEQVGLQIVNVSNPANPQFSVNAGTPGGRGVYVQGDWAYLANWQAGLQVFNVHDPANPQFITNVPGTVDARGVYVKDNWAYVANNLLGLQIIDVHDPTHPQLHTNVSGTVQGNGVFVQGNWAFLASEQSGFQIVNVSNPANPQFVTAAPGPVQGKGVFVHGIWAYVASEQLGLSIVDVSDPANPQLRANTKGTVQGGGVYVQGNWAYVVSEQNGLQIVNVSDPANPQFVTNVTGAVQGEGLFVSCDTATAYLASYSLGLQYFDITSCGCPVSTTHTLSLSVIGNGTVSSSEQPPLIQNCSSTSGVCTAVYPEGTLVTLVPSPDPDSLFGGWSGDTTDGVVTMDSDKFCMATFVAVARAEITMSGPTTIKREDELTYTLEYRNIGTSNLTNVKIEDRLPEGVSFVSASHGGTEAAGTVKWNLGTVPAGVTGQVTLTVDTSCLTPFTIRNDHYTISSAETGIVYGTVPVITTFETSIVASVNVSIISVPQNTPLQGGDLVTHTITLVNTNNERLPCLRMIFGAGTSMNFETFIDDGGGIITEQNPHYRKWQGSIEPQSTISIVFTTRLEDCIYDSEVTLNHGSTILVYNPDNVLVGSGTPQPLPVQKAITSGFVALNLGPAQDYDLWGTNQKYQVARAGAGIDFQIHLTNQLPQDQLNVSITLAIPAGLIPTGNPPFISPTDPAAVYDDLNQTISWSGMIPANQTIAITFRAKLDLCQSCIVQLPLDGFVGMCNNIQAVLFILIVPEPPKGPHLIGLNPSNGLYIWQPGIDAGFQELLCLPAEIFYGMGRSPNGDLWIAGWPVFRFNPVTLDFEIFSRGFPHAPGVEGIPKDVAYDSTTDTVVFLDTRYGTTTTSAIIRYDPVSRQAIELIDQLPEMERVVVDPNGMITGMTEEGLIQIDQADPANYKTFKDSAHIDPSHGTNNRLLCLDRNGDYVVQGSEYQGYQLIRESLVKVNHFNGTFSELVPNLRTLLSCIPSFEMYGSCAVGNHGDIYLATYSGTDIAKVELTPILKGQCLSTLGTRPTSPSFYGLSDIEYIDGIVDFHHFMQLADQWLSTGSGLSADLDGDNDVDIDDLRVLALQWLNYIPPGWPVE